MLVCGGMRTGGEGGEEEGEERGESQSLVDIS